MTNQTEGVFEGWAIAEFLGHRKLGGYIKEQAIAGAPFLRLEVFDTEGKVVATQFYSPPLHILPDSLFAGISCCFWSQSSTAACYPLGIAFKGICTCECF